MCREEASVLAVLHSGDNGDTHPPVLFSGPGCPPSKAELRPLHTGPHVGLTMLLGSVTGGRAHLRSALPISVEGSLGGDSVGMVL